jgi:serine/threonine protein kinase
MAQAPHPSNFHEPSRNDRLKDLVSRAIALPASDRAGFIASQCADDVTLALEVRELVAAHEAASNFLANPTNSETNAPTALGPITEKPGSRIGPYKLLELIGEGGFGSVFMADQDSPVRRRVALKIIKLGMDTKQVVARFEQERQALALMDHPNIAKVLDAGTTPLTSEGGGRPFFVMEYVKGDPINAFADAHKLSIADRLDLFVQVCQAVQHAHQKGVIHRDLKPSNVLASMSDGKPFARVIDFGIAKATGALGGRLTDKTLFTEHRQLIGTPEYMSPEQADGSPDLDTRTDVYALGVLLYELLTGATPFDAKRLRSAAFGEMQRIIKEEEPPVPSVRLERSLKLVAQIHATLNEPTDEPDAQARDTHTPTSLHTPRDLAGELDWIVMKALDKDRARRYETPNALAQDVRRHLAGEAVLAAPPTVGYRLRKFVRKNKGAVGAASAVVLALVAGGSVAAWQWRSATRANTLLTAQQRGVIESMTKLVQTLDIVEPEKSSFFVTLPDGQDVTIVRRQSDRSDADAVRILPGHVKQPEASLDKPQPPIDQDFAMQTLTLLIEDNAMKMYNQTAIAKANAEQAQKQAAIAEANAAEAQRLSGLAVDAAEFSACATYDAQGGTVTLTGRLTPAALRHIRQLPRADELRIAEYAQEVESSLRLLADPATGLRTFTELSIYKAYIPVSGLRELSRSDTALRDMTSLRFWSTPLDDAMLKELARTDTGFKALANLVLDDTRVTDAGIKDLARADTGLKSLTDLQFSGENVTDAALQALASSDTGLKSLTTLDVSAANVTDAGLKDLARADTGLKFLASLHLIGTQVTDAGMKDLARADSGLSKLTELDIVSKHVTDLGIQQLARADTGLKKLNRLSLNDTKLTDAGLKQLASADTGLQGLTWLNISGTLVTDEGLKELARAETGLKNLSWLTVSGQVTDAGVRALSSPDTGLKALKALELSSTELTDDGVKSISRADTGLKALTMLSLYGTNVTDTGVDALCRSDTGLKGLTALYLNHTKVTDAGVAALTRPGTGLKSLNELHLGSTNITDAAVKKLSRADTGLTSLTFLNLSQTKVTDAALMDLAHEDAGLKALTGLWLQGTLVTDEGIAAVKARWPGIEVSR